MKYICKKACFFKKRQWVPGEVLVYQGDAKDVPEHFVKKGEAGVKKAVVKEVEEPKTIVDVHKQEHAKSMARPDNVPSAKAEEAHGDKVVEVGEKKAEAPSVGQDMFD